jgi:DNA-binding NtrC family response regulator
MRPTKILALSSQRAADLALELKSTVESAHTLDFDLIVEVLPAGEPVMEEKLLLRTIARTQPQLIVLCLTESERSNAKAVLGVTRKKFRSLPIVIVMQTGDLQEGRELLALAPDDFITAPLRPADVLHRLWRLNPRSNEEGPIILQLKERLGLKQLVGESRALLDEIGKIPRVARCDASVLIHGETGTGKEMFARAIHFLSPRSAKPFSPVNCGALPVDLVENELFGHEPGAFTGAGASSVGLLRQTDGGSLFLDEVDCLPLLAQVKLLRFLQEREFRPLGAHRSCRVDVRVITASNANLEQAVKQGRFRQDLYFRLNVVALHLPPLRERKEDIPLLAEHFVGKYASAFDAPARGLTKAAVQKLILYEWPGNVRELENVIERAVVLSPQTLLRAEDIQLSTEVAVKTDESFQSLKAKMIAQFERGYIQDLLRAHNGNITRAAHAAGKHRRALWEIMRKHNIRSRI